MTPLDILLWVAFPYAAAATFIVGHVWRYRYDKFGWTTRSSQVYENRLLRIASPAFHLGILFVLVGHVVGEVGDLEAEAHGRHRRPAAVARVARSRGPLGPPSSAPAGCEEVRVDTTASPDGAWSVRGFGTNPGHGATGAVTPANAGPAQPCQGRHGLPRGAPGRPSVPRGSPTTNRTSSIEPTTDRAGAWLRSASASVATT